MRLLPPRALALLLLGSTVGLACDDKAATTAKDAKTADAKTADAKADAKTDAKTADAKADAKTADAKTDAKSDTKTDTKTPAAKPPDAKPTSTITPAARAEYHTRLEAGRKLAKAKQWADAIKEFDAALVAIPGDDRALGELSWATFSAGDFARARASANASVLAATAPKVKGAALYNLGRAEEASGNIAAARAAYEQSIAVRPNKTVSDRLAGLAAADALAAPRPCSTPVAIEKVCACLNASVEADGGPGPDGQACVLEPAGVAGVQIARYLVSEVGEENLVIVAEQTAGWSVVAQLDTVYNPGMMGISEEWTGKPAVERTVAGHTILEFGGHKSRSDSDMGLDEVEFEDTDVLVVCVRGEPGAPIQCPLHAVTRYAYVRERLGMEDTDDPEVASMRTPGLPIRHEGEVAVDVGVDGIARMRLVSGEVPTGFFGDTKLW
jgi:hypothetical protein